MTIHTQWLRVFKEEVPKAFSSEVPRDVSCVIYDAMPMLMIGSSNDRQMTWDEFISRNFANQIRRSFSMGVSTVVLSFDEYSLGPCSKSITQSNRNKMATPFVFHENQFLENLVPLDLNSRLRNRVYKRRVIECITRLIPEMIQLKSPSQRFIIDYMDAPRIFVLDKTSKEILEDRLDMPPKGENDIKFTRFCRMFDKSVVYSVDGDYLLIALNEIENIQNQGGVSPKIFIRRLRYKMPGEKRKAEGQVGHSREYEFVDIQKLYDSLQKVLQTRLSGSLDGFYMKILSLLVALCGTDFSRQLPFVTPPKLWEIVKTRLIASHLISSFDKEKKQIVVESAVNGLIACIYKQIYAKHCQGNSMEMVLSSLIKSKLSENTKKKLPSIQRVDATVRNANWVLIYWQCNEPVKILSDQGETSWDYQNCFPDVSMSSEFGFRKSLKNGAIQWLDIQSDVEGSEDESDFEK